MAFTPYYPGGWQSGVEGGTPITPDALNHYDDYLETTYTQTETNAVIAQSTEFHVGDTFKFDGAQVLFRSLSDKSAMYFSVNLPKAIGSDITSFDITITTSSNTWYTGSTASNLSIGQITSSSTFANKAIGGQRTSIKFSATTTQTPVANAGIGISELNATITFT